MKVIYMTHVSFAVVLKDYLNENNISNKEFAARIGITPKHLIDILSGEVELSTSIIQSISVVTNIPVDYIIKFEENHRMENEIEKFLNEKNISLTQYLNKFSYRELLKNKWIQFVHVDDKMTTLMDILKYLRVSKPDILYKLDKNILYKSKNDKPELLMIWLERCYRIAKDQKVAAYNKDNIELIVDYINTCAKNGEFSEKDLIKTFNKYGIKLVIQEDLPGSKIRGAFKVNKDTPSIYITYKHKRIADIYFALLHELAHCKSDFNQAKASSMVSYDDGNCEDKADKQALNWMVDDKYYQDIISKSFYDIDNENKYPKCFILYRLALDKRIEFSNEYYQLYNYVIDSNDLK